MRNRENVAVIHRAGLPPIRISKARWPVVYMAHDHDSAGHWTQATNAWWLTVRRHADGRSAVIGRRDSKIAGHSVRTGIYCGRRRYVWAYPDWGAFNVLHSTNEVLHRIGAPSAFIERVMRDVRNCLRAGNP